MIKKHSIALLIGLITIPLVAQKYDYLGYLEARNHAEQDLAQRTSFPDGKETYKKLNDQAPFALSIGISRSQTGISENTNNPEFVSKALQESMLKEKFEKRTSWLKKRQGYIKLACPIIHCNSCQQIIDPEITDDINISTIISDIVQHTHAKTLTITTCPLCQNTNITLEQRKQKEFDDIYKKTLIDQINYLGIKDQAAVSQGLPSYRYSGEMADVLTHGKLDPRKIKKEAKFLKQMGFVMWFGHHYTNPQSNPYMFEQSEDINMFAQYCKQMVLGCDHITHVCPLSQTVAFALRMAEQKNLSPFSCNINLNTYLENLAQAHIESYKAIKSISPSTQVLISHQWKPMTPKHNWTDPQYYLELLVCWIANNKYNTNCSLPKIGNKGFTELFKDKQNYFDGIALSVYPRLIFDGTTPNDPNCSGNIDAEAALEAIIKTHETFPTKPIYIAETGCNTNDPEKKKQFIDMMLHVCKLARDMGIDIRGVYCWGQTNDKDFYYEWGKPTGTSHFGPFETLDPQNPINSINAAGIHIKNIVTE